MRLYDPKSSDVTTPGTSVQSLAVLEPEPRGIKYSLTPAGVDVVLVKERLSVRVWEKVVVLGVLDSI